MGGNPRKYATGTPEGQIVKKVIQAVLNYYYALDTRQHGGVAQNTAFREIEQALDMNWEQGKEKARREGPPEKSPLEQLLAANVDNDKMTSDEFRQFVRNCVKDEGLPCEGRNEPPGG